MTVKWAAVAAIGGAIMLTGCAGGPSAEQASASASAAAQQVFLQQWHEHWPGAKDDAAVAVAQGICRAYRAGTSFRGEVDYLMATGNVTGGDAGAMIGMATASFCPEFNDRH